MQILMCLRAVLLLPSVLIFSFGNLSAQCVEDVFDVEVGGIREGSLGVGNWEVFSSSENAGAAIRKSVVEKELHHLVLTNRLNQGEEVRPGWGFTGVAQEQGPSGSLQWDVMLRVTNVAPHEQENWNSFIPMAGVVLAATSPQIPAEGEGVILVIMPGRILALYRYSGGLHGEKEKLAESFELFDRHTVGNALSIRVVWNQASKLWSVSGENRGSVKFAADVEGKLTPVIEVAEAFPGEGKRWWTGLYVQSQSAGQMQVREFRLSPVR